MMTLGSPSLDEAHLLIQERLADATHEALVLEALSASRTPRVALRPRLADALRALACRLDPSFT
jgi:hypothetical protein